GWNPEQYERFAAERAQPFYDLLALVEGEGHARVVDLGCGTGALTLQLHERLRAASTVGIDNSPAMLERTREVRAPGLSFEAGDIARFDGRDLDVVFSNAALQWVPDERAALARWAAALRPGGQLAVQMPANADHPAHTLSAELATEPPFAAAFDGEPPPDPVRGVLPPEDYAVLLEELGFARQHVRLQVYGHRLASTTEVV